MAEPTLFEKICKNYLLICSMIIGIVGLGIFIFSIAFLVWVGQSTAGGFGDSMQEIGKAGVVKWLAFFSGFLLLATSIVGCFLASKKNKILGYIFLGLMCLAIILQMAMAGVAGGTVFSIKQAIDDAKDKDKATQMNLDTGRGLMLGRVYRSLADRFTDEVPKGSGKKAWKCKNKHDSSSLMQASAENLLSFTEAATSRRLGSLEVPDIVKDKMCKVKTFKYKCDGKDDGLAKPGDMLETHCNPKTTDEKTEETFKNSCNVCAMKFWDAKEGLDHFFDQRTESKVFKKEKYKTLFHQVNEDGVGVPYCRCIGRFIDRTERYAQGIKIGFGILIVMQILLLVGASYLAFFHKEDPQPRPGDVEMTPQYVDVMCPMDSGPGKPVQVTTNDGRCVTVFVPAGVQPGQLFKVAV